MEMRTAGEGYVLVYGKDRVKSSKDACKLSTLLDKCKDFLETNPGRPARECSPQKAVFFAQVPRKQSPLWQGHGMGFPKALS